MNSQMKVKLPNSSTMPAPAFESHHPHAPIGTVAGSFSVAESPKQKPVSLDGVFDANKRITKPQPVFIEDIERTDADAEFLQEDVEAFMRAGLSEAAAKMLFGVGRQTA